MKTERAFASITHSICQTYLAAAPRPYGMAYNVDIVVRLYSNKNILNSVRHFVKTKVPIDRRYTIWKEQKFQAQVLVTVLKAISAAQKTTIPNYNQRNKRSQVKIITS